MIVVRVNREKAFIVSWDRDGDSDHWPLSSYCRLVYVALLISTLFVRIMRFLLYHSAELAVNNFMKYTLFFFYVKPFKMNFSEMSFMYYSYPLLPFYVTFPNCISLNVFFWSCYCVSIAPNSQFILTLFSFSFFLLHNIICVARSCQLQMKSRLCLVLALSYLTCYASFDILSSCPRRDQTLHLCSILLPNTGKTHHGGHTSTSQGFSLHSYWWMFILFTA